MTTARSVHRYSAYFRGWAQAFGYHESETDKEAGLEWLLSETQIGLIMTPALKRFLFPRFLGKRETGPQVAITEQQLWVAETPIPVTTGSRRIFEAAIALIESQDELHLYSTYHLFYPSGTRILTLSKKTPLIIIYKEIEPLTVRLS